MPSPNTRILGLEKELEQERAFSDWQAMYIRKFLQRHGALERRYDKPLNPFQRFIARLFRICNPPVEVRYDRKKGIELWKEAS